MEKPAIAIIPFPLSSTFRRFFVLAELITLFLEKVVVGLSPDPQRHLSPNLYFLRRFFSYATLEVLANSSGPALLIDLQTPSYGVKIRAALERFNPALEIRFLDAGERSRAGEVILAGHQGREILVLRDGAMLPLTSEETAKPHGRTRLAARATGLNQIGEPMLFYISLWLTLPSTYVTTLASPALMNFGLLLAMGLMRSLYAARESRFSDTISDERLILVDEFPWVATLLSLAVILAAGSHFVAVTPRSLIALAFGTLACLAYVIASRRRGLRGLQRATEAAMLIYLQFVGFDLTRDSSIVATHPIMPAMAALFVVHLDRLSSHLSRAARATRAFLKMVHPSLTLLTSIGLPAAITIFLAVSVRTQRLAIDLPGLVAAAVFLVASSPNRAVLSLRVLVLALATLVSHIAEWLMSSVAFP